MCCSCAPVNWHGTEERSKVKRVYVKIVLTLGGVFTNFPGKTHLISSSKSKLEQIIYSGDYRKIEKLFIFH